ncbi:MAG: hypothetical protein MUF33_00635 [Candidatus Nanopelagicales bacterium]|jgi:hypothetical protein|nr:hypothetical protein [Candidatus Nanopelagicales bacterium]
MLLLAAALAVTPPTPDWMGTLYNDRPETRLTSVVIPGTHDSGAYKIDTEGDCEVVAIAGANPAQVAAGKANPCAAGKLAKAQSQNFTSQLNGGIRYLDMRLGVPEDKVVSKKKAGKKLTNAKAWKVPIHLQHTFVSVRFTKALDQIVTWAKAHPREQVILDFQHIDLTGAKKIDKYYTSAIDKILRTYKVDGSSVCSRAWNDKLVPDVIGTTFAQAWAANRNVLVLYAKGELPKNSCYRHREKVLYSPWPNTESPTVSASDNLGYLTDRKAALTGAANCSVGGGNQCGLFVNQLQLSMGLSSQVQCLTGTRTTDCSLLELAQLRNPTVVQEMTDWRNQGLPINLSIVDFHEVGDTTPGLLQLNQLN